MFSATGLGDASPLLVVCAPHRPPTLEPSQRKQLSPLSGDDLNQLVLAGGNHWRKIFNLYAKLLHGLTPLAPDWQSCRDWRLLRSGSACALVFEQGWRPEPGQLCLVMGQTYGRSLGWLTSDQVLPAEHPFVQHPEQAVIPLFRLPATLKCAPSCTRTANSGRASALAGGVFRARAPIWCKELVPSPQGLASL